MQGGNGNAVIDDGMKIGSFDIVETEFTAADPVILLAARICFFLDRFGVFTFPLSSQLHSLNISCRHVDI